MNEPLSPEEMQKRQRWIMAKIRSRVHRALDGQPANLSVLVLADAFYSLLALCQANPVEMGTQMLRLSDANRQRQAKAETPQTTEVTA